VPNAEKTTISCVFLNNQKTFKKVSKKVLTKGEGRGIIVERSRETKKLKTEAKKASEKKFKKRLDKRNPM